MAADDLYRLRFVGDPQISPDGSVVAYVVSWVDPADHTRYRSQLMLADFDAKRPPRALTSGLHRDTAPRWSPDGCSLAFLSDRVDSKSQLFLLPLQGGEPRQLTSLKRGAGVPVWSPNGDRLAFSARVDIEAIARQEGQSDEKGKPPRVKIITRVRHKGDGEGFFEAMRKHLFVLEIAEAKGAQADHRRRLGRCRTRPGRQTASCWPLRRTASATAIPVSSTTCGWCPAPAAAPGA